MRPAFWDGIRLVEDRTGEGRQQCGEVGEEAQDAPAGEPGEEKRQRDLFPLPQMRATMPEVRGRSRRCQTRNRRRGMLVAWVNQMAAVLNSLYCGRSGGGTGSAPTGPGTERQQACMSYMYSCVVEYEDAVAPPPCAALNSMDVDVSYTMDSKSRSGPAELVASLISLPAQGGTFETAEFLGPDLAPFATGGAEALADPLVGGLLAAEVRSCQAVAEGEYPKLVARLIGASMATVTAERARHPLGLFGVWKPGKLKQRMIVDGRPMNGFFEDPPFVWTGGDAFIRMQVREGFTLQAAKLDLADFFHTCRLPGQMWPYFGLRPVDARELAAAGVKVAAEAIDGSGCCHPKLTTLPMGWAPSPGVAQGAHEAILYGAAGVGSERARLLAPLLRPADRWTSTTVPGPEVTTPHALVIDDLVLFREVAGVGGVAGASEVGAAGGTAVEDVCARYRAVGLQVKPEKVEDYSSQQEFLGYRLERNVLRPTVKRVALLRAAVGELCRRGFARPREVESLAGKFGHLFLLHRLSFSCFSAVYSFGVKNGHRSARLWPAVVRELQAAAVLLPLFRADLGRTPADVVVMSDACPTGGGAVYSRAVPLAARVLECGRALAGHRAGAEPGEYKLSEARQARMAWPPVQDWRVALRRSFPPESAIGRGHINEQEMVAATDAVRWATRGRGARGRRLLLGLDSAVSVGALTKGRSSAWPILRACRRMAALTLAEATMLEVRWVPTEENFADSPSRGGRWPGGCVGDKPPREVAGEAQRGYAGVRVGEATKPGPDGFAPFWSPLLDATVLPATRDRYSAAVQRFLRFVRGYGEPVTTASDLDYWLAFYAHTGYTTGQPTISAFRLALFGVEYFLPEVRPLPLARRCALGWSRIRPPTPAAPFPRSLAWACAALACLDGSPGVGVAIVVGFDCLLRISETALLPESAVVDTRGQADPVGQGVSIFLASTKTGRRQAVMAGDPRVADLLVRWTARVRVAFPVVGAHVFPSIDVLRRGLGRSLRAFGDLDAHGLPFTWHSLRHGGASRAYLEGMSAADIGLRGRWAVGGSVEHYVQAGRQVLLTMALPVEASRLGERVERAGLLALLLPVAELRRALGP